MHSSNNDAKNDTDVDNKLQIRQTNTPPTNSNSSQPSSPSCSTLLVIDDTSNSEDETINNNNNTITNNHTNNVPTKSMPASSAQTPHITSPPSTHDILNDTVNQQRRRNSSIAKLLGGRPLRNQQYEEIHQQILDSQSAQNVLNNNDNGTDSGIPRARSSITRTLLMNAERTNSMTKLPPQPSSSSVTTFAKDFEYLIRRELDKVESEHGSTTLQRNNSAPKVIQNLNSSSNTSAQTPMMQLKLKRKRPIPKPPSIVSNIPPFSLHDPFEIESSGSTDSLPSQTKYPHFDSSKRPRYPNPQQYPTPMTNSSSSSNQSSYLYPNKPINSTVINQFNIYQDQTSSKPCSSSCNCPQYNLTLPSPVTHLSSSSSSLKNDSPTTLSKTKSMLLQPNNQERPRQRSYSNLSDSSSPEGSPKTTVPLKKRLIDAYNNEHHQPTSL